MRGSFASLAQLPPGSFAGDLRRADRGEDCAALPAGQACAPDDAEAGPVGRRAAARLRLSIPARLTTLAETRMCVLLDLSCSGARIGLETPLARGAEAFVAFADLEVFGSVVHRGPGLNGIEFDCALTHEEVLATRRYAERHEERERAALLAQVRAWVTGGAPA